MPTTVSFRNADGASRHAHTHTQHTQHSSTHAQTQGSPRSILDERCCTRHKPRTSLILSSSPSAIGFAGCCLYALVCDLATSTGAYMHMQAHGIVHGFQPLPSTPLTVLNYKAALHRQFLSPLNVQHTPKVACSHARQHFHYRCMHGGVVVVLPTEKRVDATR